jgi:hypothetical protein
VLIFEDTDGDGRFDSRKVFLDGVHNLTGIALGLGGVWLTSPPELVFVPDRDRDDLGEMVFTNNVIGHLWHLVPGGHYERMYGVDPEPHVYELMPQCADHSHCGRVVL